MLNHTSDFFLNCSLLGCQTEIKFNKQKSYYEILLSLAPWWQTLEYRLVNW